MCVEVPMEGLQKVISMRLDGKDIVYIPTYILGLQGDIFKARISRSSMKMFATINESSESIAAPYTCSKKDTLN